MSLTIDTTPIDIDDWATDRPTVEDWMRTIWGLQPGTSSPRCSGNVHRSCLASGGWLTAMYGFSI